jgi:hypothetical protein
MRAKAITNQDPQCVVCPSSCQRVKYILNPVQTDGSVGISSFGAGKVLSGSGVSRSRASMCGSWPDDEWMERFTVCGDAFDRRD